MRRARPRITALQPLRACGTPCFTAAKPLTILKLSKRFQAEGGFYVFCLIRQQKKEDASRWKRPFFPLCRKGTLARCVVDLDLRLGVEGVHTKDDLIVGFTGPVDLQKSGRGWFTGICTDPDFGGKGIASVLFNMLMREFVDEGAQFCSLFTGLDNHAQKIYRRAGLDVVAHFAVLSRPLGTCERYEKRYF